MRTDLVRIKKTAKEALFCKESSEAVYQQEETAASGRVVDQSKKTRFKKRQTPLLNRVYHARCRVVQKAVIMAVERASCAVAIFDNYSARSIAACAVSTSVSPHVPEFVMPFREKSTNNGENCQLLILGAGLDARYELMLLQGKLGTACKLIVVDFPDVIAERLSQFEDGLANTMEHDIASDTDARGTCTEKCTSCCIESSTGCECSKNYGSPVRKSTVVYIGADLRDPSSLHRKLAAESKEITGDVDIQWRSLYLASKSPRPAVGSGVKDNRFGDYLIRSSPSVHSTDEPGWGTEHRAGRRFLEGVGKTVLDYTVPTVILAESVLSYMEESSVRELLKSITEKMRAAMVITYDPLLAAGALSVPPAAADVHGFSSMMRDKFMSRGAPLLCCMSSPVKLAELYYETGWNHVKVYSIAQALRCLLNSIERVPQQGSAIDHSLDDASIGDGSSSVTPQQASSSSMIELFDEFASLSLLHRRYALAFACNNSTWIESTLTALHSSNMGCRTINKNSSINNNINNINNNSSNNNNNNSASTDGQISVGNTARSNAANSAVREHFAGSRLGSGVPAEEIKTLAMGADAVTASSSTVGNELGCTELVSGSGSNSSNYSSSGRASAGAQQDATNRGASLRDRTASLLARVASAEAQLESLRLITLLDQSVVMQQQQQRRPCPTAKGSAIDAQELYTKSAGGLRKKGSIKKPRMGDYNQTANDSRKSIIETHDKANASVLYKGIVVSKQQSVTIKDGSTHDHDHGILSSAGKTGISYDPSRLSIRALTEADCASKEKVEQISQLYLQAFRDVSERYLSVRKYVHSSVKQLKKLPKIYPGTGQISRTDRHTNDASVKAAQNSRFFVAELPESSQNGVNASVVVGCVGVRCKVETFQALPKPVAGFGPSTDDLPQNCGKVGEAPLKETGELVELLTGEGVGGKEQLVAEINYLSVDPALHRRGIAQHMLLKVLANCAESGVQRVDLTVLTDLVAARALYKKVGFCSVRVSRLEFSKVSAVVQQADKGASGASRGGSAPAELEYMSISAPFLRPEL